MGYWNGFLGALTPWKDLSDLERGKEIVKLERGEFSYYSKIIIKKVSALDKKTRHDLGIGPLYVDKDAHPPVIHGISHVIIFLIMIFLAMPICSFLYHFVLYPLAAEFL